MRQNNGAYAPQRGRTKKGEGKPPTPRAPNRSGQSDCPVMKERETPRYHAEQETNYKI